MTRKVDYKPLVQTLTPSELRAYKARSGVELETWRQSGAADASTHFKWAIVFTAAFGVSTLYAVLSLIKMLGGEARLPAIIVSGTFALVAAAFDAHRLVKLHQLREPDWKTWARLDNFAEANALTLTPVDNFPAFPGTVFRSGHYGRASNLVHSVAEREHTFGTHRYSSVDRVLSIGNFEYSVTSQYDTESRGWGFMALQLERRLPNMVLDAKANNPLRRTNLPRSFDRNQRLSLEGDFDRYFTLYCPKKYERDALYLFTPDLMALLIDKASPFDVEIIDNWMFVYSDKPFRSTNPAVYKRLLHIADTVGRKALWQSKRYSDERVDGFSANVIDRTGQMLKGGENLPLRHAFELDSSLWLRLIVVAGFGVVLAFAELLL